MRLVHHDSKGAKTYDTSAKLKLEDPGFLEVKVSKFANKSWVCWQGRKGRSTIEAGSSNAGKEGKPCKFKVHARYVVQAKRVKCTVKWREGSDALPKRHIHSLGKGKLRRAENENVLLELLRKRLERQWGF